MILTERSAIAVPTPPDATATRLRQWVHALAVPRHAQADAAGNALVRDALAHELEHCGFGVELQGAWENVVAMPPGAAVIVAAHYDGVPGCPGADDNASGLAVLLECARRLGPGAGVGFVAFNAEEDGLLGSRDFVAERAASLRRLAACHVLEMVGFTGRGRQLLPLPWVPRALERPDYLGLVGSGASNAHVDAVLEAPACRGPRVVGAKTWGPLHRLVPDLRRSDHFPFWLAGVPAVLWTDTGNFRNPHYHRASDTPETLDYAFMRDVAELLVGTAALSPTSHAVR